MAEVLLIHGSGFGAWVWEGLIPHLNALGHAARAMDLPGRNGVPTTLADQAQAIAASLTGPTILIGHSAGGFPITAAATLCPHVTGLIYLAAYIPAPGQSVASLRRAGPSQPMRGAFRVTPDRTAYRFAPEHCQRLFFHDCKDLTDHLCAEPITPQETALTDFPDVPAAAIIASEDRAIPPDWQRAMAAHLPQAEIATGHCPHLAQPAALAALIHRLIPTFSVAR